MRKRGSSSSRRSSSSNSSSNKHTTNYNTICRGGHILEVFTLLTVQSIQKSNAFKYHNGPLMRNTLIVTEVSSQQGLGVKCDGYILNRHAE